jgi:hypothetical protein
MNSTKGVFVDYLLLPEKQSFRDIFQPYYRNSRILNAIDEKGADVRVMLKMIEGKMVPRADAEKVLVAFSEYTKQAWSLDNVQVALMPTFADLHRLHKFDLARLATDADLPYTVLDMMLAGHSVSLQDVRLVLQMASRLAGKQYTLETVDIPLDQEE